MAFRFFYSIVSYLFNFLCRSNHKGLLLQEIAYVKNYIKHCCSFLLSLALAFFIFAVAFNKQVEANALNQLGTINNPVILSFLPNQLESLLENDEKIDKTGEGQYYTRLLAAITKRTGIYFKIQQSKNYEDSVNLFCAEKTHIAALGLITYNEVKNNCKLAELLAVEVRNGESIYFSGIFVHKKHNIKQAIQLQNKTIALGNPHSTSSFNYPLAMLIDEGIQPEHDFNKIWIMYNHVAAIKKLAKGEVFAAAASFQAWKTAIDKGVINPLNFKPLLKSEPIPNPPLVINKTLPVALKEKIKQAFKLIHTWDNSEKILNFSRKIDRYDTAVDDQLYVDIFNKLNKFDKAIKSSILKKYEK